MRISAANQLRSNGIFTGTITHLQELYSAACNGDVSTHNACPNELPEFKNATTWLVLVSAIDALSGISEQDALLGVKASLAMGCNLLKPLEEAHAVMASANAKKVNDASKSGIPTPKSIILTAIPKELSTKSYKSPATERAVNAALIHVGKNIDHCVTSCSYEKSNSHSAKQ